jgi:membrane protein YdbS with pleckstrin-like domain
MLSDKELAFLEYWESNRIHQSRFGTKITAGLPMALLFGLPVILFIMTVYIFFPVWYAKIPGMTSGIFIMIIIAVVILVIFFSYFRMHFKWEMNEQLYLELKHKQSASIQ